MVNISKYINDGRGLINEQTADLTRRKEKGEKGKREGKITQGTDKLLN